MIGIIFCAYRCNDLVRDALSPWVEARRRLLCDQEWSLCVVSCPFQDFPNGPEDGTAAYLRERLDAEEIDSLVASQEAIKETEARTLALQFLIEQGCDLIWQADGDEIYTLDEIKRIFAFVERNPLVPTFRGSLKNYVFDDRTYLTDPFTPMRIHRVRVAGYQAHSFWDDNNVLYGGTITRDLKRDTDFPCLTIPRTVAWTRHLTWLNDERSHRKVRYQESRGWTCSFAWDEQRGLVWRPGQLVPETAHD